ncbi:hypothetical protein EON68_03850, partial [archaeon]
MGGGLYSAPPVPGVPQAHLPPQALYPNSNAARAPAPSAPASTHARATGRAGSDAPPARSRASAPAAADALQTAVRERATASSAQAGSASKRGGGILQPLRFDICSPISGKMLVSVPLQVPERAVIPHSRVGPQYQASVPPAPGVMPTKLVRESQPMWQAVQRDAAGDARKLAADAFLEQYRPWTWRLRVGIRVGAPHPSHISEVDGSARVMPAVLICWNMDDARATRSDTHSQPAILPLHEPVPLSADGTPPAALP